MFESFNKYGNNLYIDNIFISNSVGISNPENNDIFVKISPNPSNGIFNIEISKIDEAVNMNILNIQGQVVKSKIIQSQSNNSIIQLDLSAYPKGIYLVEFSSNKFIKTEKIIIK
ncbi:MAG: T9SS type A sorting domain-containing protein, partial [Pirellulales bacterium]|nr:T9SS type A sorting domain-containing protein [Pirellulales bacterium]